MRRIDWRWLKVLVTAALSFGCKSEPSPAKTPSVDVKQAPPLRFIKTADITTDEALRAAIDALAAANVIESSHIGAAGAQSPVYAKYLAVVKLASPEQLTALLQHESPVVRGYLVRHFANENGGAGIGALQPLLADATHVKRLDGCQVGGSSIAQLVVEVASESTRANKTNVAAQDLLVHAANSPWLLQLRYQAMASLDPAHRPAAAETLRAALRETNQPVAVLRDALRVVPGIVGAGCSEVLEPFATHDDAEVRLLAADALGDCPDAAALPMIEKLMKDRAGIAHAATEAYVRHANAEGGKVERILAESDNPYGVRIQMLKSNSPAVLAIIMAHLAEPTVDPKLGEWLLVRPPTPAFIAEVRKLARVEKSRVRADALAYLMHAKDLASLPLFRERLTSSHERERRLAQQALRELGEAPAGP